MPPFLQRLGLEPSDLVSPVVLKELRQGLRARTFLFAFCLLPAALALATLYSVAVLHLYDEGLGQLAFWGTAGLPMLAATAPAFLALRAELRTPGMELMLLTALSPWQILLGKWAALAAQFGLMAVVALPFLLVRYYVGGLELTEELATLGILLGVCQVLAALVLAASCWRPSAGQLLRVGLMALLLLPLVSCLAGLAFILLSSLLARVGLAPLNGLLIALLILSWAAGRIATETERIYLTVDRRAFYWALMATLTAQAASRLASVIFTGITAYLHLLAFQAFTQRATTAPRLALPLIPRRWRAAAATEPGPFALGCFLALAALDLVIVVAGFSESLAVLAGFVLLGAYLLAHVLPRRPAADLEGLDAAGA